MCPTVANIHMFTQLKDRNKDRIEEERHLPCPSDRLHAWSPSPGMQSNGATFHVVCSHAEEVGATDVSLCRR